MKFIHGERTELKYNEMTPLDKAINEYTKKANDYYKKKLDIDKLPADVRKQRKHELDEAKCFLEHQRMNAESYASIQAGLDTYRQHGRDAAQGSLSDIATKQEALVKEPHHPTSVLNKMLVADARPRPSAQHTAHHIVPGRGKTRFAYLARVHIHGYGIRINDPDNGVWLPTYKKHIPHWSMPKAKGHLEYHTEGYERWIELKLKGRRNEALIRMELQNIANMLERNDLPKEAERKQ